MATELQPQQPPALNYVAGFLLVGVAWGLTTPFIRRAAQDHGRRRPAHPILERPEVRASAVRSRLYGAFFAAVDLLRNPRYAVPLLINLSGSVWFFLLIGQAGTFMINLSLLFASNLTLLFFLSSARTLPFRYLEGRWIRIGR